VIVLPVAIPVAWWLWNPRRSRDTETKATRPAGGGARGRPTDFVVAVGASVLFGLAVTLPWGFGRVWDQSVAYHRESRYLYGPVEQAEKLVTTLLSRDLPLIVALALGLVATATAAAHVRRRIDSDTFVILAWLGSGTLLLIFEPTMFRNHIASLIPPLALLVAMRPPPVRWAVVAAIFVVPWWAVHLDDVLWPRDYRGAEAALVDALRALPDGAEVITDEPGFAYRAGRHLPPLLNDASIKRIEQGMITTDTIAEAAARREVCAVAIWSNRYGTELPGLPAALTRLGYEKVEGFGGVRSLWLEPDCDP
jgi:hypothetical protein